MNKKDALSFLTDDRFGSVYADELLSRARWSDNGVHCESTALGEITITHDIDSDSYTIVCAVP